MHLADPAAPRAPCHVPDLPGALNPAGVRRYVSLADSPLYGAELDHEADSELADPLLTRRSQTHLNSWSAMCSVAHFRDTGKGSNCERKRNDPRRAAQYRVACHGLRAQSWRHHSRRDPRYTPRLDAPLRRGGLGRRQRRRASGCLRPEQLHLGYSCRVRAMPAGHPSDEPASARVGLGCHSSDAMRVEGDRYWF